MIIQITLGPVPAGLTGVRTAIAGVLPDIAEAMRTEIIRLANTRLKTSLEDYIAGVSAVAYEEPGKLPSRPVATIQLLGQIPNMVENGFAGGDMKPDLLAGRNAKRSADGTRYNTVPFRHGTPGTAGHNFPAMGSALGFHEVGPRHEPRGVMAVETAARLGKAIYREAKKLSATTSSPGGGTQWGGRLEAGLAPILRGHHKTDIYAGMVRERKTYEKATQSQYFTFRRVSDNSDPRAWIHPGIEAQHLFQDAAEYGTKIAKTLIEAALEGLSG